EDTTEVPPDQLVVKVAANGDVEINHETVAAADYVDKLSKKLERKKAGDKVVFVLADEAANYGKVVSVLDGAKQAGAETLGMATELSSAEPNAPPPPAPAP